MNIILSSIQKTAVWGRRFAANPLAVHALVFLLLCGASFWIYRHGILGVPRSDHWVYMCERSYFSSDWDFFVSALGYNHTRHLFVERVFTWRPGYFALRAILELYFRTNLTLNGCLTIIWHAMTAFSLYFMISPWFGRLRGLMAALIFSAEFPGMEMVYWRYISPYTLSLFFWGMGAGLLARREPARMSKPVLTLTFFCFLFSTLFHEAPIVTIGSFTALMSAIFLLRKISRRPALPSMGTLLAVCWAVLAGSALAKAHECLWTFKTLWEDLSSRIPAAGSFFDALQIVGLFGASFLSPWLVRLKYDPTEILSSRLAWNFAAVPKAYLLLAGALILGSIGAVLFWGFRNLLRENPRRAYPQILCGLYYLILIFAMTFNRGLVYFKTATYYYDISFYMNLALIALICVEAGRYLPLRFQNRSWKKAGFVFLLLLTSAQLVYGSARIDQTLKPLYPEDLNFAKFSGALLRTMEHHPDYCLGGSTYQRLWNTVAPPYLEPYYCREGSSKTPVYLIRNAAGRYWLSKLQWQPPEGFRLSGKIDGDALSFSSASDDSWLSLPQPTLMSRDDYTPLLFEAEFEGGGNAGLFLGIKGNRNSTMVMVVERIIHGRIAMDGRMTRPLFATPGLIHSVFDKNFFLSLRLIEGRYYVFNGPLLLYSFGEFNSPDLWKGQVGIYCDISGTTPRKIRKISLIPATASASPSRFVPLIPVED